MCTCTELQEWLFRCGIQKCLPGIWTLFSLTSKNMKSENYSKELSYELVNTSNFGEERRHMYLGTVHIRITIPH